MPGAGLSRRDVLKASAALSLTVFAQPARAGAPPAEPLTPALVAAAKKEGQLVWYTSADLRLAGTIAKDFEHKFPGVAVRVERLGAERIFTRIGQEYAAGVHAVDAVNTGDGAQFLTWKAAGMLAPYLPEEVAKHIPAPSRDPDGYFATARFSLCIIAYNSAQVARDDAPKSFADLLDPKWKGKIVKAHPAYSGTVITATYQMVHALGWSYFEKLAKQDVLQIQSATDTPNKLVLGERQVMADGNEYNVLMLKDAGKPIEPVYATEGSTLIVHPAAIFKAAPHPNAARLFHSYLFAADTQSLFVNTGEMRSVHTLVKDKPGRTPLSSIKVWPDNPAGVEKESDEIKRRYAQIFHV